MTQWTEVLYLPDWLLTIAKSLAVGSNDVRRRRRPTHKELSGVECGVDARSFKFEFGV